MPIVLTSNYQGPRSGDFKDGEEKIKDTDKDREEKLSNSMRYINCIAFTKQDAHKETFPTAAE